MPVSRDRRGERGLTIIEVMIAMLLIAIAVFATVRELTTSERGTARAADLQAAAALADASLEQLRSLPYAQIALAPAAGTPQPGPPAADPLARLAPTGDGRPGYRVPDGDTEELVGEDAASPLPSYERATVRVGGAMVPMRIYRFVSWRDEECAIADVTNLERALTELRDPLQLAATALEAMVGPGGSVTEGLRDGDALLDGRLGGLVLAPLQTAVRGAVDSGLRPLDTMLRPHLGPVGETLGAVDELLDPVTGRLRDRIDLCDLPKGALPSLEELTAARAAVDTLNPVLAETQPTVAVTAEILADLAGLSPTGLLGAVGRAPELTARTTEMLGHLAAIGTVLDAVQDAGGAKATLQTVLAEARASLAALRAASRGENTTHNSKRISVAVIAEGDLAPRAPVWSTTVVTDPDEGLL